MVIYKFEDNKKMNLRYTKMQCCSYDFILWTNLSITACIYERETMDYLLAKACSQTRSLAACLGE